MTDLSWLNNIALPAFAFRADGEDNARILFWNEAMESHSNVASELALDGKLATMAHRLLRATQKNFSSANLGSLGTFEFKSTKDNVFVASLRARAIDDAENEKVMFLAMAAHDLRSPLRQISGVMEDVRDGFQDMGDGKLELLQLIEDIAERARMFTNDVITYTWSSHMQQSETCQIQLLQVAEEVFQSVGPTQSSALSCPDLRLDTDRLALQITLRNLFDNAQRYGGQQINEVQLIVDEVPDKASLRFTVMDGGKGFAASADFFVTTTNLHKSSSFGLLGVKRLIEERGGEISAIDPPNNKGSAITFTLPGYILSDDEVTSKAG